MANTVYTIKYKIQIGNNLFSTEYKLDYDGFPEMLDIEKTIKENLQKYKGTAKLIDIESVEKN